MPKKKTEKKGSTNKKRKNVKQDVMELVLHPRENIAFLDAEFNAGMDFETGEKVCEIISIGIVICDWEYNGLKKYYSLVRPVSGRPVFPVISKMTGITTQMLVGQPDFVEVSNKIMDIMRFYNVKRIFTWGASDKHSLLTEKHMLREKKVHGYQQSSKWTYIDMCTDISEVISREMLGIRGGLTINMENLMFVCDIDKKQEHNALSDAFDLYKCMKYLKKIRNKKSGSFQSKRDLVNQYYQDRSTYNSFRRFRSTSKGSDLYAKWDDDESRKDIRIKALEDDIRFLKGEIPQEMEFDTIQEYFKKHKM